ncbi:MAG: winged helix-turn-helix transcriptional regulator [Candidatus Thorarchaeota archaeon]|nr:winged helix-turn-helix transcriptional regulator [Candidatus Thorarchaeota archaeon]
MGGSASAQEIGDALSIPARTVRYRLSVMMERGMLLPSYYQTRERRVGLGEKILVVQEEPEKGDDLQRCISKIPIFYWYIPTYGKHDGYLIHSVYDVREPEKLTKIVDKLKNTGLIQDYYSFDILDTDSKRIDFSEYGPRGKWLWDAELWKKEIEKGFPEGVRTPHNMSLEDEIIECDANDIRILKELKLGVETSMTALASTTGIPVSSVREKVQRLRKKGIVKGYRRAYGFAEDAIWFSCFIKIRENIPGVLNMFYALPHPGVIMMESETSYCVSFGFTASELSAFLEGFRLLTSNLEHYAFQFHLPDIIESTYANVFDFFNEEKNRWDIPIDKCMRIIDQYS